MQRNKIMTWTAFSAMLTLMFVLAGSRPAAAQQPNKGYLPAVGTGARVNQAYLLIAQRVYPLNIAINQTSDAQVVSAADAEEGITFTPPNAQPGDVITIHGQHFSHVVLILFGTTPATDYRIISETELTATVPEDAQGGALSIVTMQTSGQQLVIGGVITPTVGPPTSPATATAIGTATVVPPTATPIPGATATPVPPTPTSTTAPTAGPTGTPSAAKSGIWISQAEIDALPASGAGWTELLAAADANPGSPSLSNQDSDNNVMVLAEALVCAKMPKPNSAPYCDKVVSALHAVTSQNLESGARALALGRELAAYVISADIIDLKDVNPALDALFRLKIKSLLSYQTSEAGSLIDCDNNRPNNWGGHCGASRIAVDLYLGDKVDLDKAAKVLQGWMGDRSVYAGFTYGPLDWQADPSKPVGVNPVGALINGHPVGGGQPEELRRAGGVHWPPTFTDYGWEGLQGRVASAKMLSRAGYPAWDWSNQALLRATQFLYDINWPAVGDDKWQIWVIDKAYGAAFPKTGGGHGKNAGWTQWTEQ